MLVVRRVGVVLLAFVALALPARAAAQSGIDDAPPVPLGDGQAASPSAASDELPNTGSDPRLLFLAGAALTLVGVGLRLRTVDADDY